MSKKRDAKTAKDKAGAGASKALPPLPEATAATPASPPPLHGVALAIVAVALSLGTFMQVLDATIANVSLPTIAGNLGESADKGTWIITAFAVANGVTVPLTGWLMRRFGIVTTFVGAVGLFTVASLLCGLAWNLPSLIAFRLLQGAVSGPLVPGSQALLIAVYPPEKRSVALAIWSVTVLVGPVAGPLLGGYISDHLHWGWIFLINVPVGILTFVTLASRLRAYNTPPIKLPIDMVGLGLLVVWVGALQLVLDLGKNADWFASPMIAGLAVVAALGCAAWVIWEVTEKAPIVDLSLLRHRNFAVGTLVFCFGYALFFANTLLLPLWLQQEQGYTASWAGMVVAPAGAMAILMAPLLTHLATRIDVRWLGSLAYGAFGVSYLHHHHPVGSARGLAPEPARRADQRRQSRFHRGNAPSGRAWPQPGGSQCRHPAASDWRGLSAGQHRPVPGIGLDLSGDDPADLADPAPCRAQGAGGGGLNAKGRINPEIVVNANFTMLAYHSFGMAPSLRRHRGAQDQWNLPAISRK